jgi:hypothetical protein
MLLEIADSSMTYRNRYPGTLEAAPLIDLLVIDETNPRSIGFQFAALRPARGGVRLGLAVPLDADLRLVPPAREGWSERLTAVCVLAGPEAVDNDLAALLRLAWSRS